MRNCSYCNKTTPNHDIKLRCKARGCRYWVHKICKQKRSRKTHCDLNFSCKIHCVTVNEFEQILNNFTIEMALPRTPLNNLNDDESENEDPAEDDEIQRDENLETITTEMSNILINSEDETYHEFEQSQIVRSTSLVNINQKSPNNVTIRPQPARLNNKDQSSSQSVKFNKEPDLNAPLFSATPSTSTKICCVCKKDAIRHAFVCKGCKKVCHPICLQDDEDPTVDCQSESYVCHECMNIFQNLSLNVNKTPKLNNLNNISSNSHITNLNNQSNHPEEKEETPQTSKFSRRDETDRILSRNKFANFPNTVASNSFGNNELESYIVKLQYNKLPVVVDSDLSWSVFYAAFVRTKNLFDPDENVVRLQAAIKDDTVKRIGGKGLFNPKTYEKCIEDVNKRLRHSFNFLNTEATALESHGRIKADNKHKLVEFIDRVRNFSTFSEAYRDLSYSTNKRFLANLSDVLPIFMRNKWESKQADLEDNRIIPSIKHLIEILEKELPRLEASIRNDKLISTDKKSEIKPPQKDQTRKHRFNNVKSDQKSSFVKTNTSQPIVNSAIYRSKPLFCWFHKNNEHSGNRCSTLWKLDGRTVSELAKKAKICTYCGQTQHKPCPFNANLKCKIEGCIHPHHSLFCFKRKVIRTQNPDNNNNNVTKTNTHMPTNNKDESEKACNNNNTVNNEVESLIDDITNNAFYSNIPEDFRNYLCQYNNSHRTSHIVTNYKNDKNHPNISKKSDRSILSVLVLTLENKQNCAFLIDSGSTVSLIEESVANNLKLIGPWLPLTLTWSGNQQRIDNSSRIINVNMSNPFNKDESKFTYFRTVKNLQICPQKFVANEFYTRFPEFDKLKLQDYCDIVGIIGIDNPVYFEQLDSIRAINKEGCQFIGVKSPLGDYIFGTECPLNKIYNDLNKKIRPKIDNKTNLHCILTLDEQNELELMEREIMGIDYRQPKENDQIVQQDAYALDLLETKVKKDINDGHYVSPLLWNKEDIVLPTKESFKLALRRYLIVEKEAIRKNLFPNCVNQVKNLLDKNYGSEMTYEDAFKPHSKAYYNPVFFIHPHNKRTRLIWDLAAKIDGKSLNDYLITGPNLYNDMLEILFKMRQDNYLIKGDIGEMFHQIKVEDDDTNCLRFLFRFTPNEKIRIFKMNVLPFGAKCSPVISQFVKNIVAKDHLVTKKEASVAIIQNSYVDDIIKSVNTPEEAINLTVDIKRILHSGGFTLLKINSNEKQIIEGIKTSLNPNELKHEKLFTNEANEKLLGYNVDFLKDEIYLDFSFSKIPKDILNGSKIPTLRHIIKVLMSIFDPLGLFQFITSKLKIVYHRACKSKINWDDEISPEIFGLWKLCLSWIDKANNIRIPRKYCIKLNEACKTQLWCFGDAGIEMTCGLIYARFIDYNNNQINVRMIYGKSFTVPINQKRTIPQLELNIALKIIEMSEHVVKMHDIKFDEVFYVTDSKVVLEWIKNGAKKATIYVSRRLEAINKTTKKNQWQWIPSELMPADYGTKEDAMPEINSDNKWYFPDIFRIPESDWTFKSNNCINLTQNAEESNYSQTNDNILDANRYSNIHSLINNGRIALKWKKIVDFNRLKNKLVSLELQMKKNQHDRTLKLELLKLKESVESLSTVINDRTSQYTFVEMLAIKLAQQDEFEKEIRLLSKGKTLKVKNRIYKLLPFLDKHDILRATSRIPHNDENVKKFGYERIFPIILPKSHALTKLYIMSYHKANLHMMNNTVITKLMNRFFIPHIRWTVNSVIKQNCYQCMRINAKPEIPLMGSLPLTRLDYQSHTFSNAIIDLAGPIYSKNYRNRDIKRYIFVCVCLTTRAVHLELIEDLTSEATLIGLQNVINIRGSMKHIVTDNGTNFVGAHAIMKEAHESWNAELIKKGTLIEPIKWTFPPAKASHMQGSVERFVGLTKNALRKMSNLLNNSPTKYNDFQLRAVLYEIAGILNNRPLTMFPIADRNNEFLTPNHFLIGRQNIQSVPNYEKRIENLTEYWSDIKVLSNILWKHWLQAYLPLIMYREKWVDKTKPLEIDDLVILADPSIANSWRMGRIVAVKPGSESQVRSVTVQLGKNKPINMKIGNKKLENNIRRNLMAKYKEELPSIVTRPAHAVAKLNIK